MPSLSRRRALRWGGLVASAGMAGCTGTLTGPSPEERVREHQEELEQLADVETAVRMGYQTTGRYVRTPDGVAGIPFVKSRLPELDATKPQAVLYDLTERGTYEPLGLKWFVPARDRDEPPSLFGKEFVGPRDGVAPFIPEHYTLHVWLFRDNPDDLFATYNSEVTPPAIVDELEPVWDALGEYLFGANAEENRYENTERCVEADGGGYGIPFVRGGADDSAGTDPTSPPILTYRVTENWTYELIGAEWYVPVSRNDEPPSMFGQAFHESMSGHSPKTDQPEHYGLHAWLFYANPRGMFEPFNPTLSC